MLRPLILGIGLALTLPAWAFEEIDVKAAPYGSRRSDSSNINSERRIVPAPAGQEEEVMPAPRGLLYRRAAPQRQTLSRPAPPRFWERTAPFRGRVGIALSERDINGRLGAQVHMTDFVAFGGDINYRGRSHGDHQQTNFGSELFFRLHVPNYSMFTPFLQAGTGYESWRVARADEVLKRSGSFLVSSAFGLEAAMTPNFGLAVQQVGAVYENAPPAVMNDHKIKDGRKQQRRTEVLFQYLF